MIRELERSLPPTDPNGAGGVARVIRENVIESGAVTPEMIDVLPLTDRQRELLARAGAAQIRHRAARGPGETDRCVDAGDGRIRTRATAARDRSLRRSSARAPASRSRTRGSTRRPTRGARSSTPSSPRSPRRCSSSTERQAAHGQPCRCSDVPRTDAFDAGRALGTRRRPRLVELRGKRRVKWRDDGPLEVEIDRRGRWHELRRYTRRVRSGRTCQMPGRRRSSSCVTSQRCAPREPPVTRSWACSRTSCARR